MSLLLFLIDNDKYDNEKATRNKKLKFLAYLESGFLHVVYHFLESANRMSLQTLRKWQISAIYSQSSVRDEGLRIFADPQINLVRIFTESSKFKLLMVYYAPREENQRF